MVLEQSPLAVGITDGYFALKTRLNRLNLAPMKPHRLLMLTGLLGLGATFVPLLPVQLEARAQNAEAAAASPAGPEQELLTKLDKVSGQVLAPDGKPIAGARLSWIAYEPSMRGSVMASVESGADGRFNFDEFRSLVQRTLTLSGDTVENAPPRLFIEAKDWGFSFAIIEAKPLEIRLAPPADLEVTYLDEAKQPAADLGVRFRFVQFRDNLETSFLPPSDLPRFQVRTDAKGVYRLSGLPQGALVHLELDDERFAQPNFQASVISIKAARQTVAPPISLIAGSTIQGRVTYGASGLPVAGVALTAQGAGQSGGWAVTDADGRYELKSVLPGKYNLALDLQDKFNNQWTARAKESLVTEGGDHLKDIDFQLERGVLITGKITAQGSPDPVEGATVAIYGPAHPRSTGWVQTAKTTANGVYSLRVPEGVQTIYMYQTPTGFGPSKQLPDSLLDIKPSKAFSNQTYEVSVGGNGPAEINWQLPRIPLPKAVQVQVVDENGLPVANAQVSSAIADGSLPSHLFQSWMTDAKGRVIFEGPREPLTLRASLDDSATVKGTKVQSGDSVTLRLEADTLTAISCRVTDAKGEVIPGAVVNLTTWPGEFGFGGQDITLNEQGRHSFKGLWPDIKYSVSATAPGYNQVSIDRMQLEPGEVRILKPIVLKKATSFLAGQAVNQNGEPMRGAKIFGQGGGNAARTVTADREGRFRFEGLVEGSTLMLSGLEGQERMQQDVKAGTSDVKLVFKADA
ncbi:hypothetical protein EON80_17310 [bacterium]|nr:MAG: hypothetical protein EON80_17310 [bacterium]